MPRKKKIELTEEQKKKNQEILDQLEEDHALLKKETLALQLLSKVKPSSKRKRKRGRKGEYDEEKAIGRDRERHSTETQKD